LEHEVVWESLPISTHRLIKRLGRNAVKRSQISVEHHLLSAHKMNGVGDPSVDHEFSFHHAHDAFLA
jgi:hypothetical protein